MSLLDLAARSVEGTGGHTSKSIAAAFVAVSLPVLAALAWLAPDADLGFSIASQVRALSASLCAGVGLTLVAVVFRVEGLYVLLAAVATAIIAASLIAEIRKRGSTRS